MDQYRKKAIAFLDANFRIFGIGHFDLTIDEIANIFKMIEENKNDDLKLFYIKLHDERMGETP